MLKAVAVVPPIISPVSPPISFRTIRRPSSVALRSGGAANTLAHGVALELHVIANGVEARLGAHVVGIPSGPSRDSDTA